MRKKQAKTPPDHTLNKADIALCVAETNKFIAEIEALLAENLKQGKAKAKKKSGKLNKE